MEPAVCECQVGVLNGGDTGELFAGNGCGFLVQLLFRGWWERMTWCGWGEVMSTLLGPEGTTVGCFSSEPMAPLVCGGVLVARHGLVSHTAGCCRVWCGAVGCGLVVC